MKKIHNPYVQFKSYHCFGCAPHNPIGLQLEFYDHGDEIWASWTPDRNYEGYMDILHGGIQATLLDEISGWVVNTKAATGGVTAAMEIRYLKPVHIHLGTITLKARLLEVNKRMATIEAALFNSSGEKCSVATLRYYLFDPNAAAEKLRYTGKESFYEES